ncbi:hypothetical protein ACOMHN_009086 [Nucella lapillus]
MKGSARVDCKARPVNAAVCVCPSPEVCRVDCKARPVNAAVCVCPSPEVCSCGLQGQACQRCCVCLPQS